jgi:hypothetical protein
MPKEGYFPWQNGNSIGQLLGKNFQLFSYRLPGAGFPAWQKHRTDLNLIGKMRLPSSEFCRASSRIGKTDQP